MYENGWSLNRTAENEDMQKLWGVKANTIRRAIQAPDQDLEAVMADRVFDMLGGRIPSRAELWRQYSEPCGERFDPYALSARRVRGL